MAVVEHVAAKTAHGRREAAPGELPVDPEEGVGDGVPQKTMEPCYGSMSGHGFSFQTESNDCRLEEVSYRSAGSRPKKATKVMNEMKSTRSAIVVRVPMAATVVWLLSLLPEQYGQVFSFEG